MTDVKTPPEANPAAAKKRQLPRGFPVFAVVAVAILAFLAGFSGGSFQDKLTGLEKNDNASYLPGSAESTKVLAEMGKFNKVENVPGFMVFHRPSGLTAEDRAFADRAADIVAKAPGVDTDALAPPQVSSDGTTVAVSTPLVQKEGDKDVKLDKLADLEQQIVDDTTAGLPGGLEAYPGGQSGFFVAATDASAGIDSTLLFAALAVVIIILLFVYRSPVLWIFPILSAVLALGLSSLLLYFFAKNDVLTLNSLTSGILPVLVIGAGTDYALLLISRYREELHVYPNRFDAMIKAWRASVPAIVASAATVILGLLCLSFSTLDSNKSLGLAAAVSIACTMILSITFLPVALAAAGRWVFWPRKPKVDQSVDLAGHGFWARVASKVDGNRRPAWIGVAVLLGICLIGLGSLNANGLSAADGFTNKPDAVVGQEIYDTKFGVDTSAPAVIADQRGLGRRGHRRGVEGPGGGHQARRGVRPARLPEARRRDEVRRPAHQWHGVRCGVAAGPADRRPDDPERQADRPLRQPRGLRHGRPAPRGRARRCRGRRPGRRHLRDDAGHQERPPCTTAT